MTGALSKVRKHLHLTAVSLAILLGAILGFVLYVTGTGPGSRWLAGQVVSRAGPGVPFELRIGAIRRSGFNRWTISRIEGREPTSNRLFLYAEQVTVGVKYQPLLSGRFEITDAHVDSLFLTAWLDSLDRLHPRLTPREADSLSRAKPDRPFPLSIEDLSVDGLALGFDDERRGLHTRLESGGVGGAGRGRDWAGRINGRFVQQTPWIRDSLSGDLKIVLGLTTESVNVDTLSWELPGFHLDARGGWHFRDSEARFTAGGHAAIDSLNLDIPGLHSPRGRLDWTAEVKAGARPPEGRITFDLNSVTADSLPPALAGGILSGGGEFNGPLLPPDSLNGEARFAVDGLQSFRGIDRIEGDVRLDHGDLDLSVHGPGLRLKARGAVLDSTGPDVDFELALDELGRFLPKGTRISGPVDSRGRLAGSWAVPEITADVGSPDLNLFGHHEKNVTGSASYVDSTVAVRLESPRGSRVAGKAVSRKVAPGDVEWRGSLEAAVPDIHLGELRTSFPDSVQPMIPDGIAGVHLNLEGTLRRPEGFIDVTTGRLTAAGVSADTAFAHAAVEPGRVHVTGTLMRTEDAGRVDLDVVIPLDESGAVPAIHPARDLIARAAFSGIRLETADFDSLWRARLEPWTKGSNLTLSAGGEASLTARPGKAADVSWTLSLGEFALSTDRARLAAAGPVEAAGSGRRLDIQPFRLDLAVKAVTDSVFPAGADSTNRIEGRLSTDDQGNLAGNITSRPIAMSDAAALFPGLPELTGSVTFRARPEGTARSLDTVVLHADLDWVKPGNRRVSLDRVAARLRGSRDGWSLDSLTVTAGGDSVLGTGSIRKPAGGGPSVLDFTLVARDFHLESVPFSDSEIRLLKGRLNANARVTGTVESPNLTGTVDIDGGAVQTSMMSAPVENMRARLRMDGNVVHVDTLEVGKSLLGAGDVTLKGKEPPVLDLKVTANNFDLKTVPLPPGSIRVFEGNLIGAAKVTGTLATPDLTGKLSLKNGAFQAGPMLLPVSGIEARMQLRGTTIVVDTLLTSGRDGVAGFSGRVDLASSRNPAFDLDGSIRDLSLSLDPGIQVKLTGPLAFHGSLNASRLSAELRLTGGRYAEKFDLRRFLARRRTFVVPSAEGRSLLNAIALDMRLYTRAADDFKVDNNLANIPMSLDLRVSGTALDWRIAGTAEAEPGAGKVYYLDREFDVNHLTMVFDNPRYPDPNLNVSAETTIASDESYDITLNVTGRASDTRTVLTSDPALSQPDIVALLTLGVPVSGLAGGGGTGNATSVFLNRAGELTTATVFSLAAQRAAALTGLSRVQFRPGAEGEGTRVTLGKDLGRRVSVDATTSLVDPAVPRLEVNWRLTRRFSIRSIGDQAAESSLDLRYVLRFP